MFQLRADAHRHSAAMAGATAEVPKDAKSIFWLLYELATCGLQLAAVVLLLVYNISLMEQATEHLSSR